MAASHRLRVVPTTRIRLGVYKSKRIKLVASGNLNHSDCYFSELLARVAEVRGSRTISNGSQPIRGRNQRTPPRHPSGGAWPDEMSAGYAAAYVGEASVAAFRAKVGSIYPKPLKQRGMRQKWARERLLRSIRERHGLDVNEVAAECENIADLI